MAPLVVAAISLAAGVLLGSGGRMPLPLTISAFSGAFFLAAVSALGPDRPAVMRVRAVSAVGLWFFLGALLISLVPGGREEPLKEDENVYYRRIATQAGSALGKEKSGLLLAVVYGDQARVENDQKENFRQAGLLHLFAASGFNVTLAAGAVLWLANVLNAPKLAAATGGLATIGFYFWLVGPSPSVTRASIMAALLYLAIILGRRVDALASTAAAVILTLFIQPNSLFDIGWQLSFASLLGILVITPKLLELIEAKKHWLGLPLSVTAGAQIAVTPFLLYYFGQFSTIALLSNPIVGGIVALITAVGFGGGLLALTVPAAGRLLFMVLSPPLELLAWISGAFSSFPSATLQTAPSLAPAMLFIALLLILFRLAKIRRITLGLPAIVILLTVLPVGGLWFDLASAHQSDELTAVFLDVGQGDSTLVKGKDGSVILVDGGSDFQALNRGLRRRGVRHIDLLMLSHAHADHVGALDDLIGRYPVKLILEPGFKYPSYQYRDFLTAAATRGIPVKLGRAGQKYRVGSVTVDVLWPRRSFISGTESDVNNNSLVVKLKYEDFSLLLPGDIQLEAIGELIKSRANLRASVLKVAHQGSANGTTDSFLRRIGPRLAVISVGKDNSYGHPHKQALNRLARNVKTVARTDRDGEVSVETDGQRMEIQR